MRAGVVAIVAAIAGACSSAPATDAGTASPSTTTTIFVAPGGSDRNSGTAAHPLRTPQVAVDRLPAGGGTVALRDGTYRGQRIVLAKRHDITVRAGTGARPVLDGRGLTPPDGFSALVAIRDSSGITVEGLELTAYRTTSVDATPAGIYVSGAGHGIVLRGNHVHDLGNDNATRGDMDINAHGIAVYGTNAHTPISTLTIEGNEVDHVRLGASEAVVVNGNVDGWSIVGNDVHDDNNIGIDAIGFEETIGGAARYTDTITVSANIVRDSRAGGMSVGGYDAHRGAAHHVTITGNVLTNDDTLHGGAPKLLVQHHADAPTIMGNTITATDADRPLLVQTTTPIDELVVDRNHYRVPADPSDAAFVWRGRDLTGLAAWRKASGQDAHSTVTTA